MDNVVIKFSEKPQLKNTILIEGLPGIGLVGKIAGDHLLDELNGKKFGEIYSPYLPPQVAIQEDGTINIVKMELYYWKGKENDIIFLIGDFQGITPDSQYQIAEKIIEATKEFDVKRVYTLGGLATGAITQKPRVFGAATTKKLVKELEGYNIIFKGGGAIFGASGLLLAFAMLNNIEAVCLMGETHGQIIDAKSAESVLEVLTKILGVKIDMTEIAKKAKETEVQINKMSKMLDDHRRVAEREQELLNDTPTYIR